MTNQEVIQLLHTATRRAVLRNRLDEAKARFRENTVYAKNGGLFQITPSFIADVETTIRLLWNPPGPCIFLDREGMPVGFDDPHEFQKEIVQRWNSAISRFHIDVAKARQTYIPDLLDECGGA